MNEVTVQLVPLTKGLCYNITGEAGIFIGGDINFTLHTQSDGLGDTKLVGTINAVGTFELFFDYLTTDPNFLFLIIDGVENTAMANLKVTLDESCQEIQCSQCLSLKACHNPQGEDLMLLKWNNRDDGFGFNYRHMPLNHSLLVRGGLRIATGEYPTEEYHETSGGVRSPIFVEADKVEEMWISSIPEYEHDALRLAIAHDFFEINGIEYVKIEGPYVPDWDIKETLLAPVIVKVQKASQNTVNDNCI